MSKEAQKHQQLGDLLAPDSDWMRQRSVHKAPVADPPVHMLSGTAAKLRRVAKIYGVPFTNLEKEIAGPTALAEVARLLWDINVNRQGRGRPADDEQNWLFFLFVRIESNRTAGVQEAIRNYIALMDEETKWSRKPKSLRARYDRLSKDWGHIDVSELQDLFKQPGEEPST